MSGSPSIAAQSPDPPRPGPRWLVPAAALFIAHALSFRFEIDDAYISFRYARNLLAGHGLVFNPGDPVEGYSNFLWVLLSAAGMRLGFDPLAFSRVLGLISGLAILVLLPGVIVRLLSPGSAVVPVPGDSPMPVGPARDARSPVIRAAPFVVAACGPIACWSLAGLETVFFAMLALLAWWGALARRPVVTGVLGILLALTRPEGLALGAAFVVWSMFPAWGRTERPVERGGRAGSGNDPAPATASPAWRRAVGGAVFTVGVVAYFMWRHATYDAWLPNTYHAKTGDLPAQIRTGLPYTLDFVRSFVGPWVGVAIWAAVARPWRSVLSTDARITLLMCLGWMGYTTAVGGDMLGMFRFMVPVLPLVIAIGVVCLQAALSADGAGDERVRRGSSMAAVAVLSVFTLLPSIVGRERELVRIHMNEKNLGAWKIVGDSLVERLPAGTTLAAGAVGYIPYRTGFVTYDLLGITDRHIARRKMSFVERHPGHEKHDGAYILARKPDYMLLGGVDITTQPRRSLVPPFSQELEIYEHPAFQSEYEQVSLPLKDGRYVNCFKRRDVR